MQTTDDAGRVPGYSYFIVCFLAVVYTFNFLDRQLMSILQESIRAELHLSDTQLGLVTGLAFALVYTFLGIPIAWLADRTRRVTIIAIACSVWSLFTAACGLATSFLTLAAARLGVGFGEAGGSPPSYSVIADYFPPNRRGVGLAIYSCGVPMGTMFGSALGAWIDKHYGWRTAFFAVGAPGLLMALLVLLLVREPPRGRFEAKEQHTPGLPLWETIRLFFTDPVLALTALSSGLTAFVGYALLNWSPSFLIRVRHMGREDVALYYSLMIGATGIVGTFASGWLVDRLSRLNPRAYALVPLAAIAVSLPFYVLYVWAPTWQWALMFLSVPGLLVPSYLAPALAVVQNAVPPAQRGTSSALLLFMLNLIGLGGGPVFIGQMSDYFRPAYGVFSLQMALYSLTPFFLLTLVAHYAASRALGRAAAVR